MWNDLTLKQKAEIMKMSVANGVTDINDIRKLYNESIHADGGHLYKNAGRIITLADLPIEYVKKYGHLNVVTPKGVRMPLSQAYRDYNQTTINVNDVPGLTDYLIKQDNPDIQEQAHLDKLAADREVRQRNNIINGPIFDKKKIYNRVPGDMWQAVVSDKDGQNIGANRGIVRSLFGYYFNPDNAVESRLQRYEKYKDLSMEEVMNASIEFDRMWEKYGLDSIRNNPILSRKMTELESKMRAPHILQHEDAKDLYLGLPQRNNTMKDAEYSPTNGRLRNGKYISYMRDPAFVNDVIMKSYNDLKHGFIDEETTHPGLYKDHTYNKRLTPVKEITPRGYARVEFPFLNNATLSGGIDPQRGEYASIFDTWDYNTNIMGTPGDNVGEYIGGEPFDIYDRYYLDDYYGINSKPQDDGYYGGYLPELSVVNKKALGGHLYKNAGQLDNGKSQPKYQYGIIEQILRENGVNFRVTSGARKPNQAGNAGKSSAHTYTIFGGSPGAIDIVPGVGSDWDTLFAQMSSPEVKKALAAYGLDVLNETNPSVMASTKATGPHLHVGRGIKGQQGLGQIFGGTSYGGGRGDTYRLQYPSQRNSNYTPMYSQKAFEPIVIGGNNTPNPWLDYIRSVESIGNQGINPVFNTPIRPTNTGLNGIKSTFTPTDFSSLSNSSDVVSPLEPYAAKQNIEYGLGLEGNALWNSPYLMFDNHSAANGGHLFDTAGQMLIRDNAVNPGLRYVYGDDYEEYIRQLRNYRPANIERRVKPRYNLSQQTDVIGNTTRPVNKSIRNKQINSPQRQQKEQKLANDRYWQNERERQGAISQASNVLRDPVYNREFANEVQALREREAEEAKKRYPVDLAMKQGLEFAGEAMRPLFITSDIGALFDPNTRSVGDFFANIWSPNNKGIFNINQGLRSWYDANPELAEGINLVVDLFGPGILGKAAKGVSKIPEASRNLVAATALNYGAKSRTLPTNIYKSRNLFINGPEGRWIKDSDPFVEFINSKRGIPFNTSFFLRTPKDINILNLRNGRYRAKAEGNVIVPSGSVDGKFVSYGEPWMEFGTNNLAAWYEFPTSIQRGGRGPHIMATDWRGNRMDYDVTEAWRNMMLRQDPKFIAEEKSMYENLRAQKFNSSQERVQAHRAARKAFYEKWGYNPDINLDVYHGNQTVIPSNRWNFNSEYPRGFLSQPFWRYTQDPYSGAVQKELMMNWESPMKTLDKTHADILPFIDPETGMWDYLTDFKVKSKSK